MENGFLLEDGVSFLLEEDGVSFLTEETPQVNYGNVVSGSLALPFGINTTYFYARLVGYLVPAVTGSYTVGVNSQDGCNLYLGSESLFPNNLSASQSAHSTLAFTQSGTVMLTAGVYYPLLLEWQHGAGANYECQLAWIPPTGSIQLIPITCLSDTEGSVTGILTGTWWNGTSGLWYPTGNGIIDFLNPLHPHTPLDSNGQVLNQLKCKPLYAVQTFNSGNPLTNDGVSKTISIAASTINWGSNAVSYNSGSVTPLAFGTFYVYADDPTFTGGAVTYRNTNNQLVVYQNDGRVYFGSIITVSGSGSGGGGGSCFSPNTRVKTQRGDVAFSDIREGDMTLTARGTWRRIALVKCSKFAGEMLDMGDDELVTKGHDFQTPDAWVRADALGIFPTVVPYEGLIANLCIETDEDDDGSRLDTEHSYTLANGHLVHNMPQGTT